MQEISVTKEGVFKLLLKLNPNKATGQDLFPARILTDMANKIAPILTQFLNRVSILKLYQGNSQGPKGQKIGPVRIVCRFMVTYIKTFSGVLPLI